MILDSMDLVVSLFANVTKTIPFLVTPLMDVACVNQDGLGMSVQCVRTTSIVTSFHATFKFSIPLYLTKFALLI